jgi:hypothetical protein
MAFEDTQECLLDHILRRGAISRDPVGDVEETVALGTSQSLEGALVPLLSRIKSLARSSMRAFYQQERFLSGT